MDASAHRSAAGGPSDDASPAELLRGDPDRVDDARRLTPREVGIFGLERLAEFAARMLGTSSSQVSLLADEQVIVAGYGLEAGAVGSQSPLEDSLCTVTAAIGGPLVVPDATLDARVRDLPPVTSGQVAAYLGEPLTDRDGRIIGSLCVYGPEPREWPDSDIIILRQLAAAVVTELELSALVREYESDRLRWGLAIDAAGIGAFDWDLTTGRLIWDDRLIEMFGYTVDGFDHTIEAFNARLHPDDRARVGEALQSSIETTGEYDAEYRILLPDGQTRWVHARGRTVADARGGAERLLGAAYDTTGDRAGQLRVTRVLEAMPAGFYSLDRDWRFTYVNVEAERLLGRPRDELLGKVLW
ncbi:MAG: PAS domain-containing protein, partial [Actinomycetes bacterium]